MRFDTKIAIAVRADLATWQKLNVAAFLASGVASGAEGLAGKPYEDGSGHRYLEMFRQPVLVYTGTGELLATARERAVGRGLATAIYTEDMFSTGHDDDNRAVVRAVEAAQLRLARGALNWAFTLLVVIPRHSAQPFPELIGSAEPPPSALRNPGGMLPLSAETAAGGFTGGKHDFARLAQHPASSPRHPGHRRHPALDDLQAPRAAPRI